MFLEIRAAIFIAILDGLTGILAGFAIFSVLGYMSQKTNVPVPELAVGGPGLSFIGKALIYWFKKRVLYDLNDYMFSLCRGVVSYAVAATLVRPLLFDDDHHWIWKFAKSLWVRSQFAWWTFQEQDQYENEEHFFPIWYLHDLFRDRFSNGYSSMRSSFLFLFLLKHHQILSNFDIYRVDCIFRTWSILI